MKSFIAVIIRKCKGKLIGFSEFPQYGGISIGYRQRWIFVLRDLDTKTPFVETWFMYEFVS